MVMLMAKTSGENSEETSSWYLGLGCSMHMIGRRDWFIKISDVYLGKTRFANDSSLDAVGIG